MPSELVLNFDLTDSFCDSRESHCNVSNWRFLQCAESGVSGEDRSRGRRQVPVQAWMYVLLSSVNVKFSWNSGILQIAISLGGLLLPEIVRKG